MSEGQKRAVANSQRIGESVGQMFVGAKLTGRSIDVVCDAAGHDRSKRVRLFAEVHEPSRREFRWIPQGQMLADDAVILTPIDADVGVKMAPRMKYNLRCRRCPSHVVPVTTDRLMPILDTLANADRRVLSLADLRLLLPFSS